MHTSGFPFDLFLLISVDEGGGFVPIPQEQFACVDWNLKNALVCDAISGSRHNKDVMKKMKNLFSEGGKVPYVRF